VALDDPIPALKEQLRERILAEVDDWPQEVAAAALGLDQPRMSDLQRGRLERFSLEKLIRILGAIDQRTCMYVVNDRKGRLRMFDFPDRRDR
jgi:predicted XRE-type DNA-binding protein